MDFGKVSNPGSVDFTLPKDDPHTKEILEKKGNNKPLEASVGCAKWNRTDLKGFFPRGTKDELAYYSTQFNSIELNATFYSMPNWKQIATWKEKTPAGFHFFPKLTNTISHYKRLIDVKQPVEDFCNAISNFEEKLGMVFLQLKDDFKPKDFDRFETFIQQFPKGIPLGVEVRNEQWFSDKDLFNKYCDLLHSHHITNIIVDTAGRRDMLHMRLTSPVAFIRYVGANHKTDTERLDDWITRIKKWQKEGLQKLYFFVHQNMELSSPLLAAHFITELNKACGLSLHVPGKAEEGKGLFD